ncbi:hypothetical protein B0H34DRAFT_656470 [Crassisporium funariophilum]|nr:hypothetical protein B0H34DRAFT_656470 [Crassisporium funariophilum]
MSPTVTPIDFSVTSLDHYAGYYATILDDVFTQEECQSLLSLATSSGSWTPAGLSAAGPTQTVHSNFRNSERILYFDAEAASRIYNRLSPLLEAAIGEIGVGGKLDGITGKKGRKQGSTWKMTGVNPRLSFLRYGPGHYFKQHCDGLYDLVLDDGTAQKSFVTIHLYLNGESASGISEDPTQTSDASGTFVKLAEDDPDVPLQGGATRFWTPDKKNFLDVFPRMGRVLVFQQRMLVHSGEEVTQGVKYTVRSDIMFEQAA